MVSSSLDMLEESLVKKVSILDLIQEQNMIQSEILKNPEDVDEKAFDETVDKKEVLIDQINALDEGFQILFDRVKGEIEANKEDYRDQIKRMQDLIQDITGKSASIEASERRNKKLAEQYFSTYRQRMSMNKQSSAVAFNYYQNMNHFKDVPPQFLDKKN